METNVTGLSAMEQTQFVVAEATEENAIHQDAPHRDAAQKKNAPESAQLGASSVAFATTYLQAKYTTKSPECQIVAVPSLDKIEGEIAAAARVRIETALRDLDETRDRIERERTARETALIAAQERISKIQSDLNGLEKECASMEHRAQTFLAGDALAHAMGNIHLVFNAKRLEFEDALATAQADALAIKEEIQTAGVTDALEIQLAEQCLERFESTAPEVAESVRLAASAEENITAAQQAVEAGLLDDAKGLLEKARAGVAAPSKIAQVELKLAEAKHVKHASDLVARINAIADQPRAVRRIRELIAEAEAAGVADMVEPAAKRALATARDNANARYAQARPIADHLAAERYVPVVGDGRIEVWKKVPKNGTGSHTHGLNPLEDSSAPIESTRVKSSSASQSSSTWVLDRVMVLRGDAWETKTPRVQVTRRELPKQAQRSRWFSRPSAKGFAPAN